MKALRIILASIKKADETYNLFKENSRICIGISGGKDSMALLYCLNLYKKYSKINFEIVPMMIDLGFPSFNVEALKEYVASLGYNLYIEDSKQVYEILKIQKEKQNLKHLPCSICSKMKKAIINKVAHKFKCNFVSFAHHKTDLIETLFLNEIYGGRIATFAPKMLLERENITFIRPFIYVDESTIKRLIKEENIPVFKSNCPNDGHTERETIKNVLSNLYKTFPTANDNFLTMLKNKEKEDILYQHNEYKVEFSNLYFKEINNIEDYLKELKFSKRKPKNTDSNFFHLHYYKNNTLQGYILINKSDRNFLIEEFKFKDYKEINKILADIYTKCYSKFNPIIFDIKISKKILPYIYIPYEIKKESSKSCLIQLSTNPAKLSKLFQNKIIF